MVEVPRTGPRGASGKSQSSRRSRRSSSSLRSGTSRRSLRLRSHSTRSRKSLKSSSALSQLENLSCQYGSVQRVPRAAREEDRRGPSTARYHRLSRGCTLGRFRPSKRELSAAQSSSKSPARSSVRSLSQARFSVRLLSTRWLKFQRSLRSQ